MAGGSTFTWKHALHLHSSLSPFASPVPQTHTAFKDVAPVSWRRLNIAGLLVTIYGLDELPNHTDAVTCLWLLHGRGDTQDSMAFVASAFLHAWSKKRGSRPNSDARNLICVSFDQRNHGSRMLDNTSNVSWSQGNPTHGPDMFALYSGTASDLRHLLTHLPSYLPYTLASHIGCGLSLGGHALWQLLLSEPRLKAGIVVVGCPDYVRLMTDRAIRSKPPVASTVSRDGGPAGRDFLGSPDFPKPLLEAIEQSDPAGILLGELDTVTGDDHLHAPSQPEIDRLRPILQERLAGKKILCLSGGKDKLVPYAQGEPFITWLSKAVDLREGWAGDLRIRVYDFVDAEGRHEFSKAMRGVAEEWLCEILENEEGGEIGGVGVKSRL